MVEANRHLKLLPTSTLDIYKVIEHIDVLSIGIQQHPYTVILTLFGSDFGVLFCTFLSQNVVITAWLRLTDTSNCFPHPHWTYTNCLSTLIGCPLAGIHQHPYTVIPTLFGSDFGILLCTFLSQNDVITSWLRLTLTDTSCFPHLHWTYTKCLSTLICCLLAYNSILT